MLSLMQMHFKTSVTCQTLSAHTLQSCHPLRYKSILFKATKLKQKTNSLKGNGKFTKRLGYYFTTANAF